jgi:hypothetical protein
VFNQHASYLIPGALQATPHGSPRDSHLLGGFLLIQSFIVNETKGFILVVTHVDRFTCDDGWPDLSGWCEHYCFGPKAQESWFRGSPRPSSLAPMPSIQSITPALMWYCTFLAFSRTGNVFR